VPPAGTNPFIGRLTDPAPPRERLRAHAEKLFEERIRRQREQLESLAARLERARAELVEAEASRERVLDERVEQAVEGARRRLAVEGR